MPTLRLQNHFFFAILIGILVLIFFIFLPYLPAIILAMVLSILFAPLHRKILAKMPNNPSISAIATLLIIIIAVLTPLFFITLKISGEIRGLYVSLAENGGTIGIIEMVEGAANRAAERFLPEYNVPAISEIDLASYLRQALRWSLSNLDSLFAGAAKVVFNIFILALALFYCLRDGGKLKKQIVSYSPLLDAYDERIFERLERAVNSVIRGALMIGVIQGVLTGVGLAIFGVPNPALWGIVAVITSLIPGLGTALVLVPAIIYLFVIDQFAPGVGLAIWAVLAVGLVDNILGPKLMERGINIHPFFILISVIGGLALFGPVGFIVGPLALAFLFALLEIYRNIVSRPAP